MKKFLFWSPRILIIIFGLFISIFALDVFSEYSKFWEMFIAFLIHLVPTYLIIIAGLIAHKKILIGGAIFIFLGLAYIYMTWGEFDFITFLIIGGPLILIGALFIISYFYNEKHS